MNFRLTAVVFGLVLLLVGGLLVSLLLDGDQPPVPDGLLGPLAAARLKADDIDSLEISRTQPAGKLLMVKDKNKKWELRQPGPAKLDTFAVDGFVRDLFRAAPTRHPELTPSPGVHGLDKPTVTVTLGAGERSAVVNLGLTSIGGDRAVTFVTTGDQPGRPLAVKRSDLTGLFKDTARGKDGPAAELVKWLPDFRARKPLGAELQDAGTEATAVKVAAGGKELSLTRGDAGWSFTAPAGWGPADELGESAAGASTAPFTGVRPLLNALTNLTVAPADYLDAPGDLAQYGLADTDPARLRVELAGKGGPPDVLLLGKPQEKDGKPVTPTKVFAKFADDPAVFALTFDRLDTLRATLADPAPLRNRDLLPATARAAVDAVDIEHAGQTAKLRKVGDGWWLFGGPAGPVEAKAGDVKMILDTLARPRLATAVLPATDDAAVTGPAVSAVARFWTASTPGKSEPGKPPAEPTVKGEPTVLTVGKVTGADAVVRRQAGGVTTDLRAPAADVQSQLARPRAAFILPKVDGFDVTAATRLTVGRGADTVEVTKDDKGNWTYAQPAAKKGQPADGPRALALLGTVGNPQPEAVAAENPSADELKKWGLNPPAVTATAAVPGGDKVIQFGGPADGGRVYARAGGSPLVLLVRKEAADELAAADLRDRTLFRLDPATVTRLTLRGYKAGDGPATYKFEKAGDKWTVVAPTPAGFQPDAAKIGQLLSVLAAPRAEAFVGAGNKPEYALDPATNPEGLEVGIERTGGPPLTLVLGAKAGDDGRVYAASSAVPGEVVTTRIRASLDPLAGRPDNFRQAAPPPPAPTPPTAAKPATPPTMKK